MQNFDYYEKITVQKVGATIMHKDGRVFTLFKCHPEKCPELSCRIAIFVMIPIAFPTLTVNLSLLRERTTKYCTYSVPRSQLHFMFVIASYHLLK